MNSALEQGIEDYVVDQLGAEEMPIGEGSQAVNVMGFEVGGQIYSIHPNIAKDVIPKNIGNIVLAVTNVPKIVPGLYMADVTLAVTTPYEVEGYNDAIHREATALFRACFPDLISLRNKLAKAAPEDLVAAQAALNAGLLKLAAFKASVIQYLAIGLSDINPWSMGTERDAVVGEEARWQYSIEAKLAFEY